MDAVAIQEDLVRALLQAVEAKDWTTVTATYAETPVINDSIAWIMTTAGEKVWVLPPIELLTGFRDLRKSMATPGHGAWMSASLTIDKAANDYTFDFNQDQAYDWGETPTDEAFIEDMQTYPRPWSEIPQWHPVKKQFTEAEWAKQSKP